MNKGVTDAVSKLVVAMQNGAKNIKMTDWNDYSELMGLTSDILDTVGIAEEISIMLSNVSNIIAMCIAPNPITFAALTVGMVDQYKYWIESGNEPIIKRQLYEEDAAETQENAEKELQANQEKYSDIFSGLYAGEKMMNLIEGGAPYDMVVDALEQVSKVMPEAKDYIHHNGINWTLDEDFRNLWLKHIVRATLEYGTHNTEVYARTQYQHKQWDPYVDEVEKKDLIEAEEIYNSGIRNPYTNDLENDRNRKHIQDLDNMIYGHRRRDKQLEESIADEIATIYDKFVSYVKEPSHDNLLPYAWAFSAIQQSYAKEQAKLDILGVYMQTGNLEAMERLTGTDFTDIPDPGIYLEKMQQEVARGYAETMMEQGFDILREDGGDMSEAEMDALLSMMERMLDVLSGQPEAMEAIAEGIQNASIPIDLKIHMDGTQAATVYLGDTEGVKMERMAEGTSYYPGGLTQINERGDEMVELPEGSRIYPAQRSREYVEVSRGGGNYTVNVYGMTVREEADVDRVASALYRKLQLAAMNR